MPIIDRSRDYRFWPTKEVISIVSDETVGTGTVELSVSVAMRSPPRSYEERTPMGGRYLVSRMTWFVPAKLLPSGTELRPNDRLTANTVYRKPALGTTTWTVDSASLNHLDQVWQLDCLHLSLRNRLKELITIQRPSITTDNAHSEVWDWDDNPDGTPDPAVGVYVDEPAALLFIGHTDVELNGQVGEREQWHIVLGRELTLGPFDRIVYPTRDGTLVFGIEDYQRSSRYDELPLIVAYRLP